MDVNVGADQGQRGLQVSTAETVLPWCKLASAPLANGQRLRLAAAALQTMLIIIQSKANKTRGKSVNVVFAVSSCQGQWWRKQNS